MVTQITLSKIEAILSRNDNANITGKDQAALEAIFKGFSSKTARVESKISSTRPTNFTKARAEKKSISGRYLYVRSDEFETSRYLDFQNSISDSDYKLDKII